MAICTLTIEDMGFYSIVLVTALRIGKIFMGARRHRIEIQSKFAAMQLPPDRRKVNAWGENHL
jgi:hypothetical protein